MSQQKNIIRLHSSIFQEKISPGESKNIHTPANNNHVESSRIGYILEIFCLHHLHFHPWKSQENIGM